MQELIALRDGWADEIRQLGRSKDAFDRGWVSAAHAIIDDLDDLIASKEKSAAGVQTNG